MSVLNRVWDYMLYMASRIWRSDVFLALFVLVACLLRGSAGGKGKPLCEYEFSICTGLFFWEGDIRTDNTTGITFYFRTALHA